MMTIKRIDRKWGLIFFFCRDIRFIVYVRDQEENSVRGTKAMPLGLRVLFVFVFIRIQNLLKEKEKPFFFSFLFFEIFGLRLFPTLADEGGPSRKLCHNLRRILLMSIRHVEIL